MSDLKNQKSSIIVALDYNNQQDAINLAKQLDPKLCRLKIGKELFTACGPEIVKRIQDFGFDVFLDLKFHDIPATVAKACVSAANLGVWMLNLHAMGGSEMLSAARLAINESRNKPILIAVTVLTSMNQHQLNELGVSRELNQQVLLLAELVNASNIDGIVCSAMEAKTLRDKFKENFIMVTPGIRPQGSEPNDQKRVMTPVAALQNGVDYLVIGRPITQAVNPLAALQGILNQIKENSTS